MITNTTNLGFPKSSNEYDAWVKMGRTFDSSAAKWQEAAPISSSLRTKTSASGIEAALPSVIPANKVITSDSGLEGIFQQVSQVASQIPNIESEISKIQTMRAGLQTQPQPILPPPTPKEDKLPSVDDFEDKGELTLPQSVLGDYTNTTLDSLMARTNDILKSKQGLIDQLSAFQPLDITKELTDYYAKLGFSPEQSFAEMKTLGTQATGIREQINALNLEEADALEVSENRPASTRFIQGEQLQIQKKYDKRRTVLAVGLSALSAQQAVLQGNISLAKSFANDYISLATSQKKFEYEQLKDFIEINSDYVSELDETYRDALKTVLQQSELAYEVEKEERSKIISWATNEKTASAFLGTDLTNISFDDAIAMVKDYLVSKPVETELLSVAESKSLNVPYGTTQKEAYGITPTGDDSAFWSEIDSGKNELQQGEPWGNVWNRIKQQFPNKSNAEIDNALGTSWREPGAYEEFKGKTAMTATTVDPQTKTDLLDDIQKGAGLSELYNAYPDVSPSLIQSLYYNQ